MLLEALFGQPDDNGIVARAWLPQHGRMYRTQQQLLPPATVSKQHACMENIDTLPFDKPHSWSMDGCNYTGIGAQQASAEVHMHGRRENRMACAYGWGWHLGIFQQEYADMFSLRAM
jgi:hypothetical protein